MSNRKDISQSVYLKLVKIFIHSRVQETFELHGAVIDLVLLELLQRFSLCVFGSKGGELRSIKGEAEFFGCFGAEAFVDGIDGAEDEFIYDVDDVVEESLWIRLGGLRVALTSRLTRGVYRKCSVSSAVFV